MGLARFLARGVGRCIYFVLGPNRSNVGRNLEIAFGPNLDPTRKRLLAKKFWIHIVQGVVEALQLSKWNAQNCHHHLHAEEFEQLESLKMNGKGLVLVSGHLGSWEVGPYAMALMGYPIQLVHNPGTVAPVYEFVRKQRERSGMEVLSRHEHPWKLKKRLDKGAWLTVVADLNAGRHGTYIPFFKVQASSYLSPAALQQASKCPIVISSTFRELDGRHRVRVWRIIPYREFEDRNQGMLTVMKEVHLVLEEAIKAHPEQWLWTYRRWRSRPKGEQPGPDGLPPKCPDEQSI